jgi:hypothetical protein
MLLVQDGERMTCLAIKYGDEAALRLAQFDVNCEPGRYLDNVYLVSPYGARLDVNVAAGSTLAWEHDDESVIGQSCTRILERLRNRFDQIFESHVSAQFVGMDEANVVHGRTSSVPRPTNATSPPTLTVRTSSGVPSG